MYEGLNLLQGVKDSIGCPFLTRHLTGNDHCANRRRSFDVLQIPAFSVRQTDLRLAAGERGVIDVKGSVCPLGYAQHRSPRIESTGKQAHSC